MTTRTVPAFLTVGAALFVLGLVGVIAVPDPLRWPSLAVQVLGGVLLVVALIHTARRL